MRTAARYVESAQQAADDLKSGHSRENNTVQNDDMDALALDVNEEPVDNDDEELLDDPVVEPKALEMKNVIDMRLYEFVGRGISGSGRVSGNDCYGVARHSLHADL